MTKPASAIRTSLSERVDLLEATASILKARGLIHRVAEDERLDGRSITLDGSSLVNFGSCSYLGLETDARLKAAACEAVLRYGVQFSSSRAYVSAPLYAEFEAALSHLVGGLPLVLAQTTSLGHLAALPVLVSERDAVLYDTQVHNSVQAVLPTLKQQGTTCEAVAHNRLDRVEERARRLALDHDRVFYLCDGVYSMHGDSVNADDLFALLDRQPALHAYVDDAHGVGWAGRNGAGIVLGRNGLHPRMIVALGLSKAFAASGAAIVVPTPELAQRLFTCGSTMIFSGPLQPAQLGAGIAAARILLSDELPQLQRAVLERIELFDSVAAREGLAVKPCPPSPIRFVEVGREDTAMELCCALRAAGYFVNVAVFPAVPRRRAGVRLMLNRHQTLEDVRGLALELSRQTARRDGVRPSLAPEAQRVSASARDTPR
jgi:7-keto-8-aminopelargonate synthetase-like enzyme